MMQQTCLQNASCSFRFRLVLRQVRPDCAARSQQGPTFRGATAYYTPLEIINWSCAEIMSFGYVYDISQISTIPYLFNFQAQFWTTIFTYLLQFSFSFRDKDRGKRTSLRVFVSGTYHHRARSFFIYSRRIMCIIEYVTNYSTGE